jgi:integrase
MLPKTAAQVQGLEPDLMILLRRLLAQAEQPAPLATWRDQVLALYAHNARSTRDRMAQALREALALAPPGATTAALTAELVARFGRRAGANATTNGLLAALRTACRLAVDWRQVDPARLRGAAWRARQTASAGLPRHHARPEVARVLDHLARQAASWPGHRLHALTAVYAYTGVRLREALRLQIADIDLDRGFLFIRPAGVALKTVRSAAPVPCPAALVAILAAWVPRIGGGVWAFPNLSRAGPWTGGTYGRRPTDQIVAAGRAVGVERFTPQSLRHSLATHYASFWGLTDRQIQLILRHTTPITQRYYVHPDLMNLAEAVRGFTYSAAARAG